MPMDTEALMSPEELAKFLRVPVKTVYQWRYRNCGPRGIKVGKHVRYAPSAVREWLEHQADPKRVA